MYRKLIVSLFCIFFALPSIFSKDVIIENSSNLCNNGELHNFVNYKCTICGAIQDVPSQAYGEYEMFILDEYDEWDEATGNRFLCINTSNAEYTDQY